MPLNEHQSTDDPSNGHAKQVCPALHKVDLQHLELLHGARPQARQQRAQHELVCRRQLLVRMLGLLSGEVLNAMAWGRMVGMVAEWQE